MKKFISLILALVMVLALAACGTTKTDDADPTDEPTVTQPGDIVEKPDASDDIPADPTAEPEQSAKPTTPPAVKPSAPPATNPPAQGGSTSAKTVDELKTYMASVINGIDEVMMPATDEVPHDSYNFLLGIDYAEGYNAVTYMPMVGSVAFQIALVSVPSGVDAATVAADIEANVDPARWVCVSADTVGTSVNGNVILMYMLDSANYPDTVSTITANFSALSI